MSYTRKHLLCTAAVPSGSIHEAAAKGIAIDALSFIGTENAENQRLGELLTRPLVAVFTSRNAVMALGDNGGRDWKIYCIGNAAVERFGEAAVKGRANSAKELAEKIIGTHDAGHEVFFFCGDRRRDELPEMLKKEGVIVHEVTVYRTILTPHSLTRQYDGIAFFSPSAAESFFSVNEIASEIPLFAIGDTTAEAIRKRCQNPVVVVERPDKSALVRLMIEYFQYE